MTSRLQKEQKSDGGDGCESKSWSMAGARTESAAFGRATQRTTSRRHARLLKLLAVGWRRARRRFGGSSRAWSERKVEKGEEVSVRQREREEKGRRRKIDNKWQESKSRTGGTATIKKEGGVRK